MSVAPIRAVVGAAARTFAVHYDEVNGRRFTEPVEVASAEVSVEAPTG